MPYTPEELSLLKELRLKNKKRLQHEYYLKVTKPNREQRRLSHNLAMQKYRAKPPHN